MVAKIKTEPKKSDERIYIYTKIYPFPEEKLRNEFIKDIIPLAEHAQQLNEEAIEHNKNNSDFDVDSTHQMIKLNKQMRDGLQALLDGQERAVYLDCKDYLVDVFLKEEKYLVYRVYTFPNKEFQDILETEDILFRNQYLHRIGIKPFRMVESDSKFSEE